MAQHKYGVRVNSEPGWTDFFKQLGNAAVIVDLLHVKPSRPIVVNVDNPTSTYSKGDSFVILGNTIRAVLTNRCMLYRCFIHIVQFGKISNDIQTIRSESTVWCISTFTRIT